VEPIIQKESARVAANLTGDGQNNDATTSSRRWFKVGSAPAQTPPPLNDPPAETGAEP
jgi:hypothetical protein